MSVTMTSLVIIFHIISFVFIKNGTFLLRLRKILEKNKKVMSFLVPINHKELTTRKFFT